MLRGNAKPAHREARVARLLVAVRLPRVGHLQVQCRRALTASRGKPLSTAELMVWCYGRRERYEPWRWWAVRRAAPRYAVAIGRSRSRGGMLLWSPNADLLRLMSPKSAR